MADDAPVRGGGDLPEDDLIESADKPPTALQHRLRHALRRPAGAALLLVLGLIAGSIGGYLVGQNNSQVLSGIHGYSLTFEQFPAGPSVGSPFGPTYGREPIEMLTADDLAALGENVSREVSIVSAQSSIPVLCGTSVGQPGTDYLGLSSRAVFFGVEDGDITQLIWPQADDAAASGTLHTLVFQAQLCPEVPNYQARVTSRGVLSGIGDEYVIFSREPINPDAQGGLHSTTVLVRVGADLIEIAVTHVDRAVPDAEARCIRFAAAAAQKADG